MTLDRTRSQKVKNHKASKKLGTKRDVLYT